MKYISGNILSNLLITILILPGIHGMEKEDSNESPLQNSGSPLSHSSSPISIKNQRPPSMYAYLTGMASAGVSAVWNASPTKEPEKMTMADRTLRGLNNWYGNQALIAKKLHLKSLTNSNEVTFTTEWDKTTKVYKEMNELSSNPVDKKALDQPTLNSLKNRTTHIIDLMQQIPSTYRGEDNEKLYRLSKEVMANNSPAITLGVLKFFINTACITEKNLIKYTLPDTNEKDDVQQEKHATKEKIDKFNTLLQKIQSQYSALEASLQELNDTTQIQYLPKKNKKWRNSH